MLCVWYALDRPIFRQGCWNACLQHYKQQCTCQSRETCAQQGLSTAVCITAHRGVSHAEIPGPEALEQALAAPAARRPVPNLGYACLNMALREQRPPIYTNRDCIKKTYDEKGLPWISALALENTRALAAIVQWNWEHDIHFFRCALLARHRKKHVLSWKCHL